ncbi:MAG: hypothetical protein LBL13_10280 [Bacteroidales bacterium]|nr:hypothetical protein [Bacteroidales bacterium]
MRVGNLEILNKNIYSPDIAVEYDGNCYFDFIGVKVISELLEGQDTKFRVPTDDDFEYLYNLGSRWVEQGEVGNNLAGRFFGKKANIATMDDLKNCIFLPATGYCDPLAALVSQNNTAYYWSSTCYNSSSRYVQCFNNNLVYSWNYYHKGDGFSVRCVRDAYGS